MLSLLIWLLILILVMGVLVWVIQQLPLPAPFGPIAIAIIGLVFILIVVSALLGEIPLRPLSIR